MVETDNGDAMCGAGAEAGGEAGRTPAQVEGGSAHGWVALPVGRAETGPTIAELVEAVRGRAGWSAARRSTTRATRRRCAGS